MNLMRSFLGCATAAVLAAAVLCGCQTGPGKSRRGHAPNDYRAQMVKDLVQGDAVAQARARQMLPFEGVSVLDDMIRLLKDPNPAVAKHAYYVMLAVCDESTTPGHKYDRKHVMRRLMRLLRQGETFAEKDVALRLIERVAPERFDADDLAEMMEKADDPVLRGRVRETLTRMNVPSAREELRKALKKAAPDFQVDLMTGLSEIRDPEAIPAMLKLADSPNAAVRAAAIHSMAWKADPAFAGVMKEVVLHADAATRPRAVDGMLRWAQAMGGRPAAREALLFLLTRSEGPAQEAVITSLSRMADPSDAKLLLPYFTATDAKVRRSALGAFANLPGDKVSEKLVAARPSVNPDDFALYAYQLGVRKHPATVDILREFAGSGDAALRRITYSALANSGQPAAADVLLGAASAGREGEGDLLQEAMMSLAASLPADQKPVLAKLYRRVYEMTQEPDVKLASLQGLARNGSTECLEVAMTAAADPTLKGAVPEMLVNVGSALYVAGDKENAQRAFDTLMSLDNSVQRMQAFGDAVRAQGGQMDLAPLLGAIRKWRVVGPFKAEDLAADWSKDYVNEKAVDPNAVYAQGDQKLEWKAVEGAGDLGMVDLMGVYGMLQQCYGYAYAEVTVPERVVATFRAGSDDGMAVWVNGAKVHDNYVDRGNMPDSDIVPIKLEAGKNTILLKILQGAGGWNFCGRLTTREGKALAFTQ